MIGSLATEISTTAQRSSTFHFFEALRYPQTGRFSCGHMIARIEFYRRYHIEIFCFWLFRARNNRKSEAFPFGGTDFGIVASWGVEKLDGSPVTERFLLAMGIFFKSWPWECFSNLQALKYPQAARFA